MNIRSPFERPEIRRLTTLTLGTDSVVRVIMCGIHVSFGNFILYFVPS